MQQMATIARIQPHNERAAAIWSAGGRGYDQISRSIADSIEHCILRLDPRPGERILDLSTGTGWTSRVLARRGATVIGADIASGLLEAARTTAGAEGLSIDYQLADAEGLPFETGGFDAVVSTCGVMFASRPEAAAKELARVCRPGGRIALTTWVSNGTLFKMFEVMKRYMPPPPSPAPPSPFAWGRTERITELLGEAFELRFEPGTSYLREPSGEAVWQKFSSGYGPTRTLAESLDLTRREAFHRDFVGFHHAFSTELGICMPRDYWLTVGTRR